MCVSVNHDVPLLLYLINIFIVHGINSLECVRRISQFISANIRVQYSTWSFAAFGRVRSESEEQEVMPKHRLAFTSFGHFHH